MGDNRQVETLVIAWVTFVLATICVFLRFLSRRLTKTRLWWDDHAALACWLTSISWNVLLTIWVTKGLGLHIKEFTAEQGMSFKDALYVNRLILYIEELVYGFALFWSKISILCFYWRVFGVTNITGPIKVLLAGSTIWILIRTVLGVLHCRPIQFFWDASVPGGHCIIVHSDFSFGTLVGHIVLDVLIIALPVWQVRKLNLQRMQKLGVMAMFTFGLFICGAAIVLIVLTTTTDSKSSDLTFNVAPIIIWATVEVNLVNVSTCLPVVKPAFFYLCACGRPTTSSLGTGPRSRSDNYSLSRGVSIKKDTRNRSYDDENDESSSTYQLATGPQHRSHSVGESSHHGHNAHHALDGLLAKIGRGPGAAVIKTYASGPDKRDAPRTPTDPALLRGGIMVKNETHFHVSRSNGQGSCTSGDDDSIGRI